MLFAAVFELRSSDESDGSDKPPNLFLYTEYFYRKKMCWNSRHFRHCDEQHNTRGKAAGGEARGRQHTSAVYFQQSALMIRPITLTPLLVFLVA
jgi:hypothetical protein